MRKLVKYEIKHSKEVVPQQCNHLLDEQKCKDTEFRYGTITENMYKKLINGGTKYLT